MALNYKPQTKPKKPIFVILLYSTCWQHVTEELFRLSVWNHKNTRYIPLGEALEMVS